MSVTATQVPLLDVHGLTIRYGDAPRVRTVVAGIDFALATGAALGIVGGSGSGKSQTALALLGLLPPAAQVEGRIIFDGCAQSPQALARLRGTQIGAVFQHPQASLSPHLRIGTQMMEVLMVHLGIARAAALAEARRWLDAVRIPDAGRCLRRFPHELSGGQCQRIAIAMALCVRPRLLIADEPTTALDATTQAQLLDLLGELRRELRLALLLISHDWGVVAELCEQTLVLRDGRIVDRGSTQALMAHPTHPYTAALIAARCV